MRTWILSVLLLISFTGMVIPAKTELLVRSQEASAWKSWILANKTASIGAQCAWNLAGTNEVVVAIVDSGVDLDHPMLAGKLWTDLSPPLAGPKPQNAIHGWDYVVNMPNPSPEGGHGTHVAAVIGGAKIPDEGVSGIAPTVKIMSLRYYSDANPGSVNLLNSIKSFGYALDHGARIVNYSGGGPEFSESEYIMIRRALADGVLVVAAAGNERQDVDQSANFYYPASYRQPNMITVAAVDPNGNLMASSNWGAKRVDVAAPGENIFSALPHGRYGYMSGTSQATSVVSGIAALILSKHPDLRPEQVRAIIVSTAKKVPALKDRVLAGGIVDACAAMQAADEVR